MLVSDADAGDTIGDDTLVSAGLLCWDSTDDRDVLFAAFFFFPWEDDILLSKLFFFHSGVQVKLAPDAEDGLGVAGEPGGDVLVLVGDVCDGGCGNIQFLVCLGNNLSLHFIHLSF